MHGVAGVGDIKRNSEDADANMSASDFLQSSVLPSSSHDLHIRAMRIKALKTFQWLARPENIYELLLTCATVQPLEKIMWTFLKWQSEGELLDERSSPLARMTSNDSPARFAIDRLLQLMTTGEILRSSDMPTLLQIARVLSNIYVSGVLSLDIYDFEFEIPYQADLDLELDWDCEWLYFAKLETNYKL